MCTCRAFFVFSLLVTFPLRSCVKFDLAIADRLWVQTELNWCLTGFTRDQAWVGELRPLVPSGGRGGRKWGRRYVAR